MFRHSALVAVLLALVVSVAKATVLVPLDFREAVAAASVIVRGHVTDVRAFSAPTGVESAVTVAVDAVLKGNADAFLTVRVPGGTLGRYRYIFVGAPTFAVNDQAFLLLKRGPDNALRLVGLSQGLFRIQLPTGASQPVVAPPPVAPVTASTGQIVRGDVRRRAMSVSEFESLVRQVMAAPTGGSQ